MDCTLPDSSVHGVLQARIPGANEKSNRELKERREVMGSDKHTFIYKVLVRVWKYNILIIRIIPNKILMDFYYLIAFHCITEILR